MLKNMQEQFSNLDIIQEDSMNYAEANPVFICTSNELMEKLKCADVFEFNEAVNRALKTCQSLSISLNQHFKRIYSGHHHQTLNAEWHFTSLACYLVIINANPANYNVARAQLFFFEKRKGI
ncbi:MAG: hypothetical protein H0V01_08795 [Bacteroidetes bacterium]|nr:hypothetical protein [Bacteroidota bacterium]HET6244587.1 hypothetical protein [Bacteroidia bacterium]